MTYIHHINPTLYDFFIFSGGEPHVKLNIGVRCSDPLREIAFIPMRINSFEDMGKLLVLHNALMGVGYRRFHLQIPYFPGARQDRIMVSGEPLTVKVYADLINSMEGVELVEIFDPHSDVTSALINNVKVINNHSFVERALYSFESDGWVLVSPDAGSNKKIGDLCKFLGAPTFIRADKSRDVSTGKITGFEVFADDLQGKTCLIIDDICDGGGTFLGLADKLKEKGAGDLYLIVSHGIFSKGTTELKKKYQKIYTTNSIQNSYEGDVEVINIFPNLNYD